ncbi:MAG: hypothetical protein QM780_02320 [Hyphomicrobium sp.]|uniref:hypothetical protein n=1 Tax=Hyphomicrobium sp. TaxID=82 RepID=UPI0039E3D015
MVHATVCRSLAAAGILALAGCAQEGGTHPAYIGLSDLGDINPAASAQAAETDDTPDVLRHIQSNKVLGAMAFQRTTGQTVDPDSLVGHDNE